jgi:hypothetical protein
MRILIGITGGLVFAPLCIVWPDEVWALQIHDSPEGYIGHQMAHGFFLVAMGMLAYWLRSTGLVREQGWRHIHWACILFAAWNLSALAGHAVARNMPSVMFLGDSTQWNQRLHLGATPAKALLYYILHMDNLLCAPAIALLFLGVRRFYKIQLKVPGVGENDHA